MWVKKLLEIFRVLEKQEKQSSGEGEVSQGQAPNPSELETSSKKDPIFDASVVNQPYNQDDTMTKPSQSTHLKLGLMHHEISIPKPESSEIAATPLEEFSNRKMRYTFSINGNYETRETTIGKFSSEIAALIRDRKGTLIGIDGVNGYKCGPTDQEILMWAHPLDPVDGDDRLVP